MTGFAYLATQYSKYPEGLNSAFKMACGVRGWLLMQGIPNFSPIVHSHPVAMECGLDPTDHRIWLPDDLPMMRAAVCLIVHCDEGWAASYGISKEIEEFERQSKPVFKLVPGENWDGLLTDIRAAIEINGGGE